MTSTDHHASPGLRITILGTGNIARTLGDHWANSGHTIVVGGRSSQAAHDLASDLGHGAQAASLIEAVSGADAVLLAIPWAAVDQVLTRIEAPSGRLSGVTLIDPTNPVAHGVGLHLLPSGSAAEHNASRAPGARVVKAFNVHPAARWNSPNPADVVTIAGNDATALDHLQQLVHDVGATPYVLGGLDRARQIEEFAGTVIALAFGGVNPRDAVPGT